MTENLIIYCPHPRCRCKRQHTITNNRKLYVCLACSSKSPRNPNQDVLNEERPKINEERPKINEERPKINEERPKINEERPKIKKERTQFKYESRDTDWWRDPPG
jgi:hypothetical protein